MCETTLAPKECPECHSSRIAVEVKSWADFEKGKPVAFDDEDVDYAEAIKGGQCICRDCQLMWRLS